MHSTLFAVLLAGSAPAEAAPGASDTPAVLAPVHAIMDGIRRRDASAITAQVHPTGNATAVIEQRDGTRIIRRSDWATYLGLIRPGPERYQARLGNPSVEIDGDIAVVWVPYTFMIDGAVQHSGVDHFDLVRENSQWKVLNETWSQRTHGPAPPPGDAAAVLVPVNALFAAFEGGDAAAMLRQVYPEGRVTASDLRADGASGLRQQSWTQFAGRIRPNNGFQERISNPVIRIDGDIAMVWAPFVVRVTGVVGNCGVDHFDLVRENGTWKVMNLTFSSRTSGCPTR